ncbi:MAG TPA: hypothetical protein VM580_16455, partial [Labilithrix sp.]|nr:hypothetical protein [Labilithrix sp.]
MNLVYLSFAPVLIAPGVGVRAAQRIAPTALLLTSVVQATAALVIAIRPAPTARLLGGFVTTDATSRLFLVLINLIFLGIAGYVWNRARPNPSLADSVSKFARLSLVFMGAA